MRRTVAILALALVGATQAADLPERRGSAAASTPSSGPAPARPPAPLDPDREVLVDMHQQIEQLQNDLRSLRGRVETQTFELEQLKNRNRDTAADLDRRLREFEKRPGAAPRASTSDEPPAAATPAAAINQAISPQEQKDYDAAFKLLSQGAYDRAIKAYRDFLKKYPRGGLSESAQYRLADALYVSGKYRPAIDEFSRLIRDYPGSDKASDAALKIGLCHYELGDKAAARKALTNVGTRYPGTPAAKSAAERLAKMKKEGK